MRSRLLNKAKPDINSPEFKAWFAGSKVVDAEGQPLVVFHGTDVKFSRVVMSKGTQGLFWFTSNRTGIESGEIGANGKGLIMELYISIKKPAGWKEYEQLLLVQLKRDFDGVILPNGDGTFDGFVFNANQVKIIQR